MFSNDDILFMKLAINLASQCRGEKHDPLVGAVIAKNGQKLGAAFRGQKQPGDHAEFTVLEKELPEKIEEVLGSTVYTTLEPCTSRNHPKVPCAQRLVERRVARVVIGVLDPNQNICGRGVRTLRDAGITTELFPQDLMSQVEVQNRDFTRHQLSKDARLIPCGIGQMGSDYDFKAVADGETKELYFVVQNLRTLLDRGDFLPHVRHLLASGTRVTFILTTLEVMKAVSPEAVPHFKQSVEDLRGLYLSLLTSERDRLRVHFHRGPASLSAQVRDPYDPTRALLVINPKWSTDTEPENRPYFVLERRLHTELFKKLFGAIPAMCQADSMDLRQMCENLGISWPA
jgi:pyrimidine deaminase RibD-like protein